MMRYHSTRSKAQFVTASEAILKGLADDGGLFVPECMPKFEEDFTAWAGKSYQEVAYEVMKLFLTDYTEEELKLCINRAYDDKFDTKEIAPLREADGVWYLELFHGPTIAFKDMALSILPHLMTTAAKKNGQKEEIVILTATSGDTGKAAMAGFADVEGTQIIVFYPKNGVSAIQERQMVTQKGANTHVVGIRGNFDDAQSGVKNMLSNRELGEKLLKKGYRFSSANSINIGRLVPQVVYYVYSYVKLLEQGVLTNGAPMNVVVPTGNFGNILAAYYAKLLGVPVGKLLCASNDNKVLYDFFQTGVYDKNRPLLLTTSPSMDILVSSNLERLLYHMTEDTDAVAAWMQALAGNGRYEISAAQRERLAVFDGGYANEAEVTKQIQALYEKTGYVIDTHTAVAAKVCEEQAEQGITLVASTASPFKFGKSVLEAVLPEAEQAELNKMDDFAISEKLSKVAKVAVPKAVTELQGAPVLHNTVCAPEEMQAVVEKILGEVEEWRLFYLENDIARAYN